MNSSDNHPHMYTQKSFLYIFISSNFQQTSYLQALFSAAICCLPCLEIKHTAESSVEFLVELLSKFAFIVKADKILKRPTISN